MRRLWPMMLCTLTGCVSSVPKEVARENILSLSTYQHLTFRDAVIGGPDAPIHINYTRDPTKLGAPILVMLHGSPSSLLTWHELVFGANGAGLGNDYDVIALDLPGAGLSSPSPPYSWDRLVDSVAMFLRLPQIAASRVCVVGNSYGGEVAWRLALRHPDLVDRLVLIGSSGYPRGLFERDPVDSLLRVPMVGECLSQCSCRCIVEAGLQSSLGRHTEVPQDLIEQNFWMIRADGNRNAMVALARLETGDWSDRIPQIAVPTLLIWGDQDDWYPVEQHGQRFAQDIVGSRLETVPRAGHTPHVDHPVEVASLIRAFMSESEH